MFVVHAVRVRSILKNRRTQAACTTDHTLKNHSGIAMKYFRLTAQRSTILIGNAAIISTKFEKTMYRRKPMRRKNVLKTDIAKTIGIAPR